jgi:hypothetical protein
MLSDGRLLAADAYNYQVQWFDLDGRFLRRVGHHLLWLWPRPARARRALPSRPVWSREETFSTWPTAAITVS